MAYQYQNNLAANYYPQQPMFPQPQGNVYVIQNSLEVANIPAGAGITAALCLQENLLYMKSMQNGMPVFLAYKLAPYTESPKTTVENNEPTIEDRIANLEKQLSAILNALGGNKDATQSKSTTTTNQQWDT